MPGFICAHKVAKKNKMDDPRGKIETERLPKERNPTQWSKIEALFPLKGVWFVTLEVACCV